MLVERVRRIFVEASRARHIQILVPATVLIEFSIGHGRHPVRTARVLNVTLPLPITVDIAQRASTLLIAVAGRKAAPSLTDGIVAAWGERYGAVVTTDPDDLGVLAAAGSGFEVHAIDDLLAAMQDEPTRRR